MGDNITSVMRTLVYSDIFDFPLTKEELAYYLHSPKKVGKNELLEALKSLSPYLEQKNNFYALSGRAPLLDERIIRQKHSRDKLLIAQSVATYLSLIPSVLFIGVSGSVAVGNAKKEDDIDFFIITKRNTLYTTRLLALCILQLLGKRRKRNERYPQDKVCLNMLITEDALRFPPDRQDLYTAHEIAQLLPLRERDRTYEKFLQANSWVNAFLPHARGRAGVTSVKNFDFLGGMLSLLEPFCRIMQVTLMKSHHTREEISPQRLAFHPKDTKRHILSQYQRRINAYSKYYT